ncbi:unnamed protein product [Brassicogethes aeneus]|uniref:Uncharacterized protein n=1 Tax=Brassicogethes aeneus TaxID=1431903 RepID=A0A9P0FHU0_BRAAE|nr:unnamed protein product [Brassicogethes aeneus]
MPFGNMSEIPYTYGQQQFDSMNCTNYESQNNSQSPKRASQKAARTQSSNRSSLKGQSAQQATQNSNRSSLKGQSPGQPPRRDVTQIKSNKSPSIDKSSKQGGNIVECSACKSQRSSVIDQSLRQGGDAVDCLTCRSEIQDTTGGNQPAGDACSCSEDEDINPSQYGAVEEAPCNRTTCSKLDDEKQILDDIENKDIACINPDQVMKLVEKERTEVETFSTMASAYVPFNPSNFSPKQKLQQIRMNSETMAMLYKTILNPSPSADEAQYEPTPEMMVSIMQAIERKVEPTVDPTRQFNALFTSNKFDELVKMSPVAEGYFQDIVVPLSEAQHLHEELITRELRIATYKMEKAFRGKEDERPRNNLFAEVKPEVPLKEEKIKTTFEMQGDSPWGEEDLMPATNVIGAGPGPLVEAEDVKAMEGDGPKVIAMTKGIEYFVETETPLYESKVQLRGTNPPLYFPGYVYALPYTEDPVHLAKSPSEVFQKAWKSIHPNYFTERSVIYL